MNWLNIITTLYGCFSIFLGVQAWLNVHSSASLIAGAVSGLIVLLGTALTSKNATIGYLLVTLVCIGLIGRFLPSYMKDTSKLYPALLVVIVSVFVLLSLIFGHFTHRHSS